MLLLAPCSCLSCSVEIVYVSDSKASTATRVNRLLNRSFHITEQNVQATDYDLEQAANLFFASEAEANEPAQGGNPVPSPEAQGAAHGSARSR